MPRNLTLFAGTLLVCLMFGAPGAVAQYSANAYCNLTLSPASLIVDAAGSTGTITVSAGSKCAWSAYTTKPWLALTSATSGIGAGTLKYSIIANNAKGPVSGQIMVNNYLTQYAIPVLVRGSDRPQTYSDVPLSHPAYDYINIARMLQLSRGCEVGLFCPDAPSSRADSAALIVRAILGENFTYNPVPYFTDVPAGHPQFSYIQKLRELNVTYGCATNPLRYCPEEGLWREQAAAMMVRAKSQGFVTSPGAYFEDITAYSSIHFPSIQKIRELGVTQGCSATPALFCPKHAITRAQLMIFIIRYLYAN